MDHKLIELDNVDMVVVVVELHMVHNLLVVLEQLNNLNSLVILLLEFWPLPLCPSYPLRPRSLSGADSAVILVVGDLPVDRDLVGEMDILVVSPSTSI